MTSLLEDKLIASAPARVVSLSSSSEQFSYPEGIVYDQWTEKGKYEDGSAYGQSKFANVLVRPRSSLLDYFVSLFLFPSVPFLLPFLLPFLPFVTHFIVHAFLSCFFLAVPRRCFPTFSPQFAKKLASRLSGTGVTAYSGHPGVVISELFRHMDAELGRGAIMQSIINSILFSTADGALNSLYLATSETLPPKNGGFYHPIATPVESLHGTGATEKQADELWTKTEEAIKEALKKLE